ncbi:MAG: hypothetical protein KDC67_07250 [Ignavibacteriae bacterium]|nr:hypothetical protein [Ignavibacteriota bacterium]
MNGYNELDLLLEALKKSLGYALDQPKDKNTRPTAIDFCKDIYTPFEEQDSPVLERLKNFPNHFTIVTGPIGRGKTSLLAKSINLLPPSTKYFIFDFKNEIEKLYEIGRDLDLRQQFLHNLFKEELANIFLKAINLKIDFIYTALIKFFFSTRMQQRIFQWRNKFNKNDIGENLDDLKKIFMDDYEVINEEDDYVMKNLTCSQMISCISESQNIENFIIVLDNVDRINSKLQPTLFSVAIDIFHGGKGDFGVLVAIREKNILRFELTSHGGDVIEVVSLQTHAKERTRPIRMHKLTKEFVESLLSKRYDFAIDTLLTSEDENIKKVFNQLRPLITRKFIEERIYNISNHNLRTMLTLNYEFIYYLILLIQRNKIVNNYPTLDIDAEKINSYFFRWIYAVANQRHELLLDMALKYDISRAKNLKEKIQNDIDLVVLAYLSNNTQYNLRISNVCNIFKNIGIKTKQIIKTIYKLYSVEDDVRYIELGDSEAVLNIEDIIRDDCRVKITPLGNEFVSSTITKFEFLYHCLTYPNIVSLDSPEMLSPVQEERDKKIETVLKFLENMKSVHLEVIKFMKEKSKLTDSEWEEYFRNNFCVKNQFIIERIAISHISHFKETSITNKYQELLDSFYDDINTKTRSSLA